MIGYLSKRLRRAQAGRCLRVPGTYQGRNLESDVPVVLASDEFFSGVWSSVERGSKEGCYTQVTTERCKNDVLGLVRPRTLPGYPDLAACTNYKEYRRDVKENGARCDFGEPSSVNVMDPVSGAAVDCASDMQVPSQDGWGIQNSHFMNWVRISALKDFRKLWGTIQEPRYVRNSQTGVPW